MIKIEKIIKSLFENKGKRYSIIVKYRPPVKGNSTSENKMRKQKLKEEAIRQLDYSTPKHDNVKIKIQYYNSEGSDDVLNVEGGIADALQEVAYDNDRQIRSSCIDEHLPNNNHTWYQVNLEFLGAGIPLYDVESKKLIKFDVEGKPPKKSNWGTDDAPLIVKFREAALKARKISTASEGFDGPVRLSLIVYAPNTTEMNYKQTGDDDPKKFIGDLDSLVAGVCEYLQPAPTNPDLDVHSVFEGKDEIAPHIPLIIRNDAQIVEINAKKEHGDTLHYHVEIEYV